MTTQMSILSGKPGGVIGVKELRRDASGVIGEVERGNWFVLSKRGTPVGVLLPSSMAEELLMQHAEEILSFQLQKGHLPPRAEG